jgi:hypothetical protein
VARLRRISAVRIVGKSFATGYAGDTHDRPDTSDALGSDAVDQWVWGLSDHRCARTFADGDLLKRIGRGEAAVSKSPVIRAFGGRPAGPILRT